MKKIVDFYDFHKWTEKNNLNYRFETKKYFNDAIVVFDKKDNCVSVKAPELTGIWNNVKNTIKKALL